MNIDYVIGNRRVILYGTGNTGNAFYKDYREKLSIFACTSSEKVTTPIGNIPVIQYNEIDKERDFLIICSIYYDEIRRKLLLDGFRIYDDFLSYKLFSGLYRILNLRKKVIVCVGQCEIREISTALLRLESFNKIYEVFYFDERKVCSHGDKFGWEDYCECSAILKWADFFMMPSVFNPKGSSGFDNLIRNINKECRIIKVSLFDFDSYWAQDIARERTLSKYYVTKPEMKICAYANRDQIVERLVDENYTVEQIMKTVKRKDLFTEDVIWNNHGRSIRRAELTDRISDIKIADFVISSFNKVKLYCDRGHFSEPILREYVRRILLYFNENECIQELKTISLDNIFSYHNELPIYPSTSEILKLDWVTDKTLYRMVGYDTVKLVTFDEYMEKLIRYYMNVKKVLNCCYMELPD